MTILVTGAAGFIGSHIVDECISRGYKVHGIDDMSTGVKSNINPKCNFINDDIREFDYESIGEVDCIFHTAARARIQPSWIDTLSYESVNVIGTLRIIRYAIKSKAKIIFSSSSSVYGVKGRLSAAMDENYPLNPSSPYALQKLMSEKYLKLYHDFEGLDYIAFRYFNVYGPRQIPNGAYAAVVGIFLNQFKNNINFTIYGDGSQKRDFTFVKDVVEANMKAMESSISSGVYNIGTGTNHSVLDIANYISPTHNIENLPKRIGEAQETLADYRRAFTDLKWEPKTRIDEWLKSESIKA